MTQLANFPKTFIANVNAVCERAREMALLVTDPKTAKKGLRAVNELDAMRMLAERVGADIPVQNQLFDATHEIVVAIASVLQKYRGKQGPPKKNESGTPVPNFEKTCTEVGISQHLGQKWLKIRSINGQVYSSYIKRCNTEMDVASFGGLLKAKALRKRQQKTRQDKQPDIKKTHPNVKKGDFRKILAKLHDVDAIITDPPYGKEHLGLWSALGQFAADRLVDNGVLLAYSGQMYLPNVLQLLSEHLDYWWTFAVVHKGSGNLTPLGQPVRKVINKWKPVVMFVQRGGGFDDTFLDIIPSVEPEKHAHNWAQSIQESIWMIETFTEENALVVDPMAGSGTVGYACDMTGRKFSGAEIL